MHEGKYIMLQKDFVSEYGVTTATTLRLVDNLGGIGRTVIGNFWFGSVKTAVVLKKVGLYSILLVKTARKKFPRTLLNQTSLKREEWVAYTGKIEEVELQACSFQDLKLKQFITTCSTSIPGAPRKTKHHGDVPRPKVAETYLKFAASIDVHNHVRTGSLGLEDVFHTHTPQLQQFAGIVGFLFSNSYLAFQYFKPGNKTLRHVTFKMALANALVTYTTSTTNLRSSITGNVAAMVSNGHTIAKLRYPKPCYYCKHGFEEGKRISTTFKCSFCKVALCKPSSSRKCWALHLTEGLPKKRRIKKQRDKNA